MLPSSDFKPDFSKGLIPAIAQDSKDGEVLMLAYMNEEAWNRTLETGEAHYWSRSRQKLWHKGETSGNVQKVHSIRLDCDKDTILLCFFRKWDGKEESICSSQVFDPEKVYGKK